MLSASRIKKLAPQVRAMFNDELDQETYDDVENRLIEFEHDIELEAPRVVQAIHAAVKVNLPLEECTLVDFDYAEFEIADYEKGKQSEKRQDYPVYLHKRAKDALGEFGKSLWNKGLPIKYYFMSKKDIVADVRLRLK